MCIRVEELTGLEHLTIGSTQYRVEYKDLQTLYGQIRFDTRCIELAEDLAEEETVYDVLHGYQKIACLSI